MCSNVILSIAKLSCKWIYPCHIGVGAETVRRMTILPSALSTSQPCMGCIVTRSGRDNTLFSTIDFFRLQLFGQVWHEYWIFISHIVSFHAFDHNTNDFWRFSVPRLYDKTHGPVT